MRYYRIVTVRFFHCSVDNCRRWPSTRIWQTTADCRRLATVETPVPMMTTTTQAQYPTLKHQPTRVCPTSRRWRNSRHLCSTTSTRRTLLTRAKPFTSARRTIRRKSRLDHTWYIRCQMNSENRAECGTCAVLECKVKVASRISVFLIQWGPQRFNKACYTQDSFIQFLFYNIKF